MNTYIRFLAIVGLVVTLQSGMSAQARQPAKSTKAPPASKYNAQKPTNDPVVGKTRNGKRVYEGARGGFYYLTEGGNRAYVRDFVGAKIVGKTADGLLTYEGARGGRFYYRKNGDKVYIKQ